MDIIEDSVITSQPKVTPEQCIPTLDPPSKRDRIEDCCTCYCCLGPTPDWARSHSSLSSDSVSRGSCDNDDNGNIKTTMLNEYDIQATQESEKSNGLDCNWWSKHVNDRDHGHDHDYGSHNHDGHDTSGGGCDSGGVDAGGGDCGGGD